MQADVVLDKELRVLHLDQYCREYWALRGGTGNSVHTIL